MNFCVEIDLSIYIFFGNSGTISNNIAFYHGVIIHISEKLQNLLFFRENNLLTQKQNWDFTLLILSKIVKNFKDKENKIRFRIKQSW